jgi:prepilin-type N-terminal cleavage/methylation domain-containing protein
MDLHGIETNKMIRTKVQKKLGRSSKGFTLIELILYVALSSIFMTAAVLFAWDIVYGRIRSFVEQEVNQNMRLASKRIAYEIRNASAINSTGTSLSLAMADSARNPTVIDISSGRIRIGYGSSGSCPASSPCFLTDNLVTASGITFTDFSSGTDSLNVRFTFTISKTGGPDEFQETQTYTSSAEVRSH